MRGWSIRRRELRNKGAREVNTEKKYVWDDFDDVE